MPWSFWQSAPILKRLGKQQESSQNKRPSYHWGNAKGFRHRWERPNMFITVLYKLLNLWQLNHQVHVAHVDMVFILYLWDPRGLHWRKEITRDRCRWSWQGRCGIDLKWASKRSCLACSTEKPGHSIGYSTSGLCSSFWIAVSNCSDRGEPDFHFAFV